MNIRCWLTLQKKSPRFAAILLLTGGLMYVNGVQAAVSISSCSITTPPSLNFGTYDPLSSSDDTTSGQFTISCTVNGSGGSVSATLSASIGSGTSYSTRVLKSGTNELTYNIYRDTSRTQILGNGSSSTYTTSTSWTSSGTKSWQTNVYGKIPKNQYNVVPGSYSDSITWTVTY